MATPRRCGWAVIAGMVGILGCLAVSGWNSALAATLVVRHMPPEEEIDPRQSYFLALLKLALDETVSSHGPYELRAVQPPMYQSRALLSLNKGLIDVTWTMTSKDREAADLPVRIPLMKGLIGYRVLIIHRDNIARFTAIDDAQGLQKLLAFQGHDWPDASILAAHGFREITSSHYLTAFKLLSLKRFDYFPRSILEAWAELDSIKDPNLVIEDHLALQYPAAIYFFVAKYNIALQQRLYEGLMRAYADGSFDRLFYKHPAHLQAFTHAHLSKRTLIHLDNPLLPAQTPLQNPRLWYHPGDEKPYLMADMPP